MYKGKRIKYFLPLGTRLGVLAEFAASVAT